MSVTIYNCHKPREDSRAACGFFSYGGIAKEKRMDEEKKDEEQIVKDTDADTKDVEQTQQNDFSEFEKRMSKMEAEIMRMSGVVSAVQKAQNSIVDMGAVIRENPVDDSDSDDDSFVPLEKLDFSMK